MNTCAICGASCFTLVCSTECEKELNLGLDELADDQEKLDKDDPVTPGSREESRRKYE